MMRVNLTKVGWLYDALYEYFLKAWGSIGTNIAFLLIKGDTGRESGAPLVRSRTICTNKWNKR